MRSVPDPETRKYGVKALILKTTVAPDGAIDLHRGPPYPSDRGVWQGKMPDVDIDHELAEMNRLWEKSMEPPE